MPSPVQNLTVLLVIQGPGLIRARPIRSAGKPDLTARGTAIDRSQGSIPIAPISIFMSSQTALLALGCRSR